MCSTKNLVLSFLLCFKLLHIFRVFSSKAQKLNDVSKNFDFSLIAEIVPNLENIGIEFFFISTQVETE